MIGDTADALLASWKRIADTQLRDRPPFLSACEQRKAKGIRFNVRILAPEGRHELREWEPRLVSFLSDYGFDVTIDNGVRFVPRPESDFDDTDLLIILPLSDDIECFCVDFATEQSRASKMLVCVPEGHDNKCYCRLIREKYQVQTVTLPVRTLVEGGNCRFGLDVIKCCADDMMEKVASAIRQLRIKNTVVVLIHGIRTRAQWQGVIRHALEARGLIAIPTNYEKFDVVRFLLPFEKFKQLPVKKVDSEIRAAKKKFPDASISLLAHSFGTYITGKLLSSAEHKFDRVALCGSVLRSDFDFASSTDRFSEIVNEVGCRDIWPVLAAKLSWGYGPTGSFGFNRGASVRDRKHAAAGHSYFLSREFCESFWVPYFCDGNSSKGGDVAIEPSRLITTIDRIPFARVLFWGTVGITIFYALKWLLPFVSNAIP